VPSGNQSTFDLIPAGQLGILESDLPGQPIRNSKSVLNATISGSGADINRLNGTVFNGGNFTEGEGWARTLQRELANRFIANVFCSWCVGYLWYQLI
jgi:alpha,alpha-trehalase